MGSGVKAEIVRINPFQPESYSINLAQQMALVRLGHLFKIGRPSKNGCAKEGQPGGKSLSGGGKMRPLV